MKKRSEYNDKHERPTLGKLALDAQNTSQPTTRDPIELQRAMLKDYVKNVLECYDNNKTKYDGDFYIVVLVRKERLLTNVTRNFYLARQTCPTPDYDQTVYQCNNKDDSIKLLWTLPSIDTCSMYLYDALNVDPEEKELLNYIIDFTDGTLMKKALELNKELNYEPLRRIYD